MRKKLILGILIALNASDQFLLAVSTFQWWAIILAIAVGCFAAFAILYE